MPGIVGWHSHACKAVYEIVAKLPLFLPRRDTHTHLSQMCLCWFAFPSHFIAPPFVSHRCVLGCLQESVCLSPSSHPWRVCNKRWIFSYCAHCLSTQLSDEWQSAALLQHVILLAPGILSVFYSATCAKSRQSLCHVFSKHDVFTLLAAIYRAS